MYITEKECRTWIIFENLRGHVGYIDGPILGVVPLGVSSCVLKVAWYVFVGKILKV